MADLGAIGLGPKALVYSCQLDVAAGWNITNNPIVCREITSSSKALPKREDWKAIAGVVKDGSDAPAVRLVRAFREDTGAYVGGAISDGVTGAFTINISHPGEHTVVAYPVTGENLPALVHHGVIPI